MEQEVATSAGGQQMAAPAASSAGPAVLSATQAVSSGAAVVEVQQARPRRFHGTVPLDPLRAGADAGKVAQEVISHLSSLPGARVEVTLEIEADVPDGVPEHVVRVVTENARTLKFTSQGFERE